MTVLVSIDGRIVPPERAEVSVFDRGFLYGDSVFEVLRTYGGVLFGFEEHLARLGRSAELAAIAFSDLELLRREVLTVIAATGNAETYVRIVVTRGSGKALGLDPALARAPSRVVIATEVPVPPAAMYERGIGVITYRTQRISEGTSAVGAKLGNYLLSILATREATARGADEALILNAQGEIVEGTTSNVFLVKRGGLVTPPDEAGILAGITRGKVFELAKSFGIPCELRTFLPAELAAADEAFITSSIRELVPVVAVDGKAAGGGKPGPVTARLLQGYRALTRVNGVV
jgi:branched-chain amino acid aminotransferase